MPGWGILEVQWQFLSCTLGPCPCCCSYPEKAAQHLCCLGAELGQGARMCGVALLSELVLNWGGKSGLLASRWSWKVVVGRAGCGLQINDEEFGEGLLRGRPLPCSLRVLAVNCCRSLASLPCRSCSELVRAAARNLHLRGATYFCPRQKK